MEPLKIHIELSVKDETLKQITALATFIVAGVMAKANPGAVDSLMNDIKAGAKPAQAPEPKPVKAEEPKPAQAPADDMPADIADPISDDEVLAVVARKKKGNAKSIKAIFATYGCTCSTDCPQASRAAMIRDIEALPDNA